MPTFGMNLESHEIINFWLYSVKKKKTDINYIAIVCVASFLLSDVFLLGFIIHRKYIVQKRSMDPPTQPPR